MSTEFATILALIFIAISTSLFGVFVLWKRLSFFGDAISHSILLGAALGAIFSLEQNFSLTFFALLFALLVNYAGNTHMFSKDTIIAISSYFCVALALLLNDFLGRELDFSNYVFGDIANVTPTDLTNLAVIATISIIFTFFAFKKLLLINISNDLARIENIKIERWNLCFIILLTLTIAVCVKIVGVLLMTALLIMPAAIARLFSHNALSMLLNSLFVGIIVCTASGLISTNFNISVNALTILFFGMIFIPCVIFMGRKIP